MEPIFAFDPRWAFAPGEPAAAPGIPEVACPDAVDQCAAVRLVPSRHTMALTRDNSVVVPVSVDDACRYAEPRGIVLGWFGVLPQAFGEIDNAGALCGMLIVARPRFESIKDGLTGELRLVLHDDETRRRPMLAATMALCRRSGMTRLVVGTRAGCGIDLDSMGFTALDVQGKEGEPRFSRVLRFGERIR